MNLNFEPYIRYIAKTTYFIDGKYVIANDCRILYILSGNGSFECDDNIYPLNANTLIYYPYGMPYRIKSDGDMLFYTLNFDFNSNNKDINTMSPQSVNEFDYNKIIPSIVDDAFKSVICTDNALWAEKYIRNIYNEALERKQGYTEIQSSLLKILIINIYRNVINDNSSNKLCYTIKKLILNDCSLNNKKVADILGYHPFYLNDIFKKNEGLTLHKYILKQRLIRAYELLNVTDKSLEEIADICGFSSQAHLSAAFKKEYGISPGKLRLT